MPITDSSHIAGLWRASIRSGQSRNRFEEDGLLQGLRAQLVTTIFAGFVGEAESVDGVEVTVRVEDLHYWRIRLGCLETAAARRQPA
jgi:hypothetical protein